MQVSDKNRQASNLNFLPKIDLFASYSYLGDPLTIDLDQVRSSTIEGISAQGVMAEDRLQQTVTGQGLTDQQKADLFKSNSSILENLYPSFDAKLSEQNYFLASLGVRQPIYLGGKLNSASRLAESNYASANIAHSILQNNKQLRVAASYMDILFLNGIKNRRAHFLEVMQYHLDLADTLIANEMIASYERLYAEIEYTNAQNRNASTQRNLNNAYTTLKAMSGMPADTLLSIHDTLEYFSDLLPIDYDTTGLNQNLSLRMAKQQEAVFEEGKSLATSRFLPDIYAVGAYNLYQKNLPATLPNWFVGVEFKMNIFNGLSDKKRHDATKLALLEYRSSIEEIEEELNLAARIQYNSILALNDEYNTQLKSVELAELRVKTLSQLNKNNMISVKDLVDGEALLDEMDMARMLTLYALHMAIAQYYALYGRIDIYINKVNAHYGF
jgi:outer membrane protein TolC